MEQFLLKLLVFLAAAVIAVPLARKCKLGSVLGYLIAGIVIGPFGLSLIDDIEVVMHFTEFGVVMMLFLVGLELKPSLLWHMRTPILGMGGSQVILTFAAISADSTAGRIPSPLSGYARPAASPMIMTPSCNSGRVARGYNR